MENQDYFYYIVSVAATYYVAVHIVLPAAMFLFAALESFVFNNKKGD